MPFMHTLLPDPANVQPIQKKLYQHKKVQVSVLRLDRLHPVVSGNKWFKLKGYLEQAAMQKKKTIVTFGGAYSNHILATAAACADAGFSAAAIIRGEPPLQLSQTLQDALAYGMKLIFSPRAQFRSKQLPHTLYADHAPEDCYLVPEGGKGALGAAGAATILHGVYMPAYSCVLTAVGTGTTLAGLTLASGTGQTIVGISVLKNAYSLDTEIAEMLPAEKNNFRVLHDFHFGGYGRHTPELLTFMNDWYRETGIPSDFVYTAKMFYAADALVRNGYFPPGSNILLIHTGGLQGNRSLPKGTLIF